MALRCREVEVDVEVGFAEILSGGRVAPLLRPFLSLQFDALQLRVKGTSM